MDASRRDQFNRRDPLPEMKVRITVLMSLCLVMAGALGTRAAFIQILSSPRLETMARRQFQSKVLIRPRRGNILDRNGEPLVVNVETHSLAVNPSKARNKLTLARLLAKALDMPYKKVLQRIGDPRLEQLAAARTTLAKAKAVKGAKTGAAPAGAEEAVATGGTKREFAWIKRHLTEAEMSRLKRWKIIDAEGDLMPGLWLIKESQRTHPHGDLAAQILGNVNVDSEGLEGIELSQNDRLRGKVVSVTAIKDALGRPAFIDEFAARNTTSLQDNKDGEAVTLTIDSSLQFAVEQELRHAVQKANAKGGSVIVMNAVSGEILAMANMPTYTPAEKAASPDRRRNRAVTDGMEPGSIMKPILLAGALSRGMKLTDQLWGERGQFFVQGRHINEAEAHEKFEWLSLKQIIKVSSNVGAAKLALKLGAEPYYNTLRAFGLGQKTDIDFPGEISGRLPKKPWQALTLANVGFGQGVLTTPIQMVRAYSTFLNGGWLVEPTLIKDANIPPAPAKRIITAKVAHGVVEALESVTEEKGTGVKAALDGYRVAGKTGTAQKVDPNTGAYSKSKYLASFVGFAVDVEPKIAIYASVDEPHGVYYAGETAAPLFREVLNAVANRFSLPAKLSNERMLADAGGREKGREMGPAPAPVRDTLLVTSAKPLPTAAGDVASVDPAVEHVQWYGNSPSGALLWKMPQLRGLTPREAMGVLKGHKFQLELLGAGFGVVHGQVPEEGKVIADGDTVRLTLAEP